MTAHFAPSRPAAPSTDPRAAFDAGLGQLTRYLARAWSRAGVGAGRHDDCTQAVHLGLIEAWGPDRYVDLVGRVGSRGVRATLGRGTSAGLDFLRAVDRVKKRELRARCHLPLDPATADCGDRLGPDREVLREAVAGLTVPREAELLAATLASDGPAAIAARWGLAAKTVSNEKTRVLNKLRVAMLAGSC